MIMRLFYYMNSEESIRSIVSMGILVFLVIAILMPTSHSLFEYSMVKSLVVKAPAVSSNGTGILSNITLIVAYPGNGRVFFSALPYTEVETQGAARVAAYIASIIAETKFSSYDYYVIVESNIPLIGGPSAGGLMTVGFTILLMNLTLDDTVTMTGMINPDGSIGQVGGLKEKLEAAYNSGYKVFLIPRGQRIYTYPVYEEIRKGPIVLRRITYRNIDLVEYGKTLGIDVVEISNIAEALYYFTGINIFNATESIPVNGLREDLLNTLNELFTNLSRNIELLIDHIGGINQIYSRHLSQTYNNILQIREDYPVYSLYSLLHLYKKALYVYWALLLNKGEISIDGIVGQVNEALNTTIELYSEKCTLGNGLIQSLLYSAWLNYNQAISISDISSKISYLTTSLMLIELSKIFNSMSLNTPTISCSTDVLVELYSHAYSVYTYVERLIKEAGGDTNVLSNAAIYINVMTYAYEASSTAIYGAVIYTIAYSTSAVHEVFRSTNYILEDRNNLLKLYMKGRTLDDLALLLIQLSNEALLIGDNNTSIEALSTIIAYLQVQGILFNEIHSGNKGIESAVHTQPRTQPMDNAIIPIYNTTINTTSGESPFTDSWEIIILLTMLLLLISLLILILNLRKSQYISK